MATNCKKCGGIIPDIILGHPSDGTDCKYHRNGELNIKPLGG